MTSKALEFVKDCTSECEARMKCDLIGERFDSEEYMRFSKMEDWEKTLYIYHIDCIERNVMDMLYGRY